METMKLKMMMICLLFLTPNLFALDWVRDFDAGLEEAYERGAPIFIFLCQDT